MPTEEDHFVSWWVRMRKRVPSGQRKAFDSLVVAAAWELWLQRHERIFSGSTRAPADLEGDVNARLDLWCRMGLVARSQFERI
jgi:hypothetical protein